MNSQHNPLQEAIDAINQMRWTDAKRLLTSYCGNTPNDFRAWFLLGSTHHQLGENKEAINAFQNAIDLNPSFPASYHNLGIVYESGGDIENAENAYRNAIAHDPNYTNARFALGHLYEKQDKTSLSIETYQDVIKIDPNFLSAINNLAALYLKLGEFNFAEPLLLRALKIAPSDLTVLVNYSTYLCRTEQYEKSYQILVQLYEKFRDNPAIANNFGLTLTMLGRYSDAENVLTTLQRDAPSNRETYINLSLLFGMQKRYPDAIVVLEHAINLDPNSVDTLNNYGDILAESGNVQKGIEIFLRSLELDTERPSTHFHLAQSYLLTKQWETGWNHYRYRCRLKNSTSNIATIPLPTNCNGIKITVLRDQGLGDELFFLRFLPELSRRNASIKYYCNNKLFELLKTAADFFELSIDDGNTTIDKNTFLVSDLPFLLEHNSDKTIPPPFSLSLSEKLLQKFELLVKELGPPPYIGLTWRAGAAGHKKLFKEIPLQDLAAIIRDTSATFIALQRQPRAGEIESLAKLSNKNIHDLSGLNDDLVEITHLLAILDDYVSVSNTNIHIRAGLNKIARVLIPHPPEWRWLNIGKHSPWFPHFTTYRQDSAGSWTDALRELQNDIG